MSEPVVALVGGFLGAGKTSLLVAAGARLRNRGIRVAVITNDQGGQLVDTQFAEASGFRAEEITGGCFCCRFSDFLSAVNRLLSHDPEVIFAEPVGSCMDISATILQPVKAYYGGKFRLAPFTVLVDPESARRLLAPDADARLAYLFRNQVAEADIVCFSKADLHADFPELPGGADFRLSSRTGEGLSGWLEEVLAESKLAGLHLLDIDYQKYAEAEAALGWLNWQASLRCRRPLTPAAVVGPLVEQLDQALTEAGIAIAHLKVFDQAATGHIKASVCRNGEEPLVDGALDASPARRHTVTLNLRACAAPDALEAIVARVTKKLPGSVAAVKCQSFRPASPKPEHRMQRIVTE